MEQINKIRSIADLINHTHGIADRGYYGFRGELNHEWSMLPTLLRLDRPQALMLEGMLFSQLLLDDRANPIPYLNSNDPVEYLMILQHYEVPTKLLDCTFDPLIALFFACHDKDGKWKDYDGKVRLFPVEQFAELKMNDPETNSKYAERITVKNIENLRARVNIAEHRIVKAPLICNPRMQRQEGFFIFFSSNPLTETDTRFVSLETFLGKKNEFRKTELGKSDAEYYHAHLLVDKSAKETILEELDRKYGINPVSVYNNNDHTNKVRRFFTKLHEEAKYKTQKALGINWAG